MRSEDEIRARIKEIEEQQRIGIQTGTLTIDVVRNILISNFKWILEEQKMNTDEFELIRQALEQYSNLDDCFIEGYVTFDDLRNNYGLENFTDTQIEKCAKEEGYEVEDDKILDPSI